MSGKRVGFPFRWAFPVGQLLLCVVLLWPLRAYVIAELKGHSVVTFRATKFDSVSDDQIIHALNWTPSPEQQRAIRKKEARLTIPDALNVPVTFLELPFAVFRPSHRGWTPHGMDFRVWRAISYPLAGLIFWWIAGRGLDALVASRKKLISPRIRWIEVTVAVAIFLCVLMVLIGFVIDASWRGALQLELLAAGALVWTALATTVVVARVMQWRIRKGLMSEVLRSN